MSAAGTPYAWGGGTCDGPSDDMPPYDYGDIGYDCSGLVCWAVCQVTGRDLFSDGLRVTNAMYCADEGTLGYKCVFSPVSAVIVRRAWVKGRLTDTFTQEISIC